MVSSVIVTLVAVVAVPIMSRPFMFKFPTGSKKGAGDMMEPNDTIPPGVVVACVTTKLLFDICNVFVLYITFYILLQFYCLMSSSKAMCHYLYIPVYRYFHS